MPKTAIHQGETVYVRAYSTQRSAIAELITMIEEDGREWGRVRLATEWHDWDEATSTAGPPPTAGDVLQVEAYRLESIRW